MLKEVLQYEGKGHKMKYQVYNKKGMSSKIVSSGVNRKDDIFLFSHIHCKRNAYLK